MSPPPGPDTLFDAQFEGCVIEWRGPAPFLFVPVPEEYIGELWHAARHSSYGWGVVPVSAELDGISCSTSLFPRSNGYLLPVKKVVQKAAGIGLGSRVAVRIIVAAWGSRTVCFGIRQTCLFPYQKYSNPA